jgi:hypothetical protein
MERLTTFTSGPVTAHRLVTGPVKERGCPFS